MKTIRTTQFVDAKSNSHLKANETTRSVQAVLTDLRLERHLSN